MADSFIIEPVQEKPVPFEIEPAPEASAGRILGSMVEGVKDFIRGVAKSRATSIEHAFEVSPADKVLLGYEQRFTPEERAEEGNRITQLVQQGMPLAEARIKIVLDIQARKSQAGAKMGQMIQGQVDIVSKKPDAKKTEAAKKLWTGIGESKALQTAPEYKGSSSGILEDLARNATAMVPGMAASIINPAFGTGAFYDYMKGSTYEALIEKGVDPARAEKAATISATAQTPLEATSALFTIKKMLGGGRPWIKYLTDTFSAMVGEGATEFIQEYPDAFAQIWAEKPGLSNQELAQEVATKFPEITKNAGYSAVLGALTGGIFAGAGAAVSGVRDIVAAPGEKKPAEQIQAEQTQTDSIVEKYRKKEKVKKEKKPVTIEPEEPEAEIPEPITVTDEQGEPVVEIEPAEDEPEKKRTYEEFKQALGTEDEFHPDELDDNGRLEYLYDMLPGEIEETRRFIENTKKRIKTLTGEKLKQAKSELKSWEEKEQHFRNILENVSKDLGKTLPKMPEVKTGDTTIQAEPEKPNVEQGVSSEPPQKGQNGGPKTTPAETTPADLGATHEDYEPGHPWYYKLGGKILEPDEIEARDISEDVAIGKLPKDPKKRLSLLEEKKRAHEEALAGDIERYNRLRTEQDGAVSDYDKRFGYDWQFNLSLKHNHISYNKGAIKAIQKAIDALKGGPSSGEAAPQKAPEDTIEQKQKQYAKEGKAIEKRLQIPVRYEGPQLKDNGDLAFHNFTITMPGRETTISASTAEQVIEKYHAKMKEYDRREANKKKEPWQKTREEIILEEKASGKIDEIHNDGVTIDGARIPYNMLNVVKEHRKAIEQALSEGKPVPDEVLKHYPNLKSEYAGTPIEKLSGMEVLRRRSESIDGVSYELYGDKYNQFGVVRVVDVDSGNLVSQTRYPKYETAERAYLKAVEINKPEQQPAPEKAESPQETPETTTDIRTLNPTGIYARFGFASSKDEKHKGKQVHVDTFGYRFITNDQGYRVYLHTPEEVEELKNKYQEAYDGSQAAMNDPDRFPAEEIPKAPKTESPSGQLSDQLCNALRQGRTLTTKTMTERADKIFGGTMAEGKYSIKDLYDAMELGINKYIAIITLLLNPRVNKGELLNGALKTLKDLMTKIPTQTKRTEEMQTHQQFSTPPPLAFMANWVANIQEGETYLEPSAGVGGLAVFGSNAGARVIVNELSERRLGLLKELAGAIYAHNIKTFLNENAEQLNNIVKGNPELKDTVRPTVIVMNPPFSATAGRMKGNKTEYGAQHIEQALKLLEPGGRLVAIVGKGMAMDRPTFRAWWDKIKKEYNVRANVGVSGKEYAKYGTTFDNQILVIDKTGETISDVITSKVEKIEELVDLLEGVRNDRTFESKPGHAESALQEGPGEGKGVPGTDTTVLPSVGEMGPGKRPGGAGGRPAVEGAPGIPHVQLEEQGQRDELPSERGESPLVGQEAGGQDTGGPGRPDTGTVEQPVDRGSGGISEIEDVPESLQILAEERVKQGEISESIYEAYSPELVRIPGSKPHPTKLVQSAAMAAVAPPMPKYRPSLPKGSIEKGKISDIQLEAVVYAGQAHELMLPDGSRRGFFIGDGTGVGKGREIASILWDNWNKGRRKGVWITEKRPLFKDAQRDMNGIGWDGKHVFDLAKIKNDADIQNTSGIAFLTYDTLKSRGRIDQLLKWLGDDFDGVIAFDEAHNMGNAVRVRGDRGWKEPAAKALAGVDLQNRLKNSRKLYVSATGATEVLNLAYAEGLGLWGQDTPFPNKDRFVTDISAGGVAAMELVARDMKALGAYVARSLSYDGVETTRLMHELTDDQKGYYNRFAQSWQIVLNSMHDAMDTTGATHNPESKSSAHAQFWGAHQRFFNQIITSFVMPSVINGIRADLARGDAVVIQLTNTLDSQQERAMAKLGEDQDLEDLDMSPKELLLDYVDRAFPTQQYEEYVDENGNIRSRPVVDANGNPVQSQEALEKKEELLNRLSGEKILELAVSPIDMIIEEFGVENVAEVTGRKRRIIKKKNEKTGAMEKVIDKRSDSKAVADADAFMNDKKQILIFSEKGGTGRSYHADLESANQRKRAHYLLQPGWRADKAIQGLGRTHRSNQKQPPRYILCTTDIKGQKRFLSSIARRLEQLGALTKGQRQTGNQGIFNARDNLESTYAKDALRTLFRDIVRGIVPEMDLATFQSQSGLRIADDGGNLLAQTPDIKQFLNRLLSFEIDPMNALFDAFSERLDTIIERQLEAGTLDQGMETLKAKRIEKASEKAVYTHPETGSQTKYVQLDVTNPARIVTFAEISTNEGVRFYQNIKSGKVWGGVERMKTDTRTGSLVETVHLTTQNGNKEYINKADIQDGEKWKSLTRAEAERLWNDAVEKMPKEHTHREHLITGMLLPVWDRLIGHPRIMRVQTASGETMIGRIINAGDLSQTLQNLGAEADAIRISPAEVVSKVLEEAARITLANGWRIQRSRVSGENRIELVGPTYSHMEELSRHGIFNERIQWNLRFFIPTEAQAAERAISGVTRSREIVNVETPQQRVSLADLVGNESGFISTDLLGVSKIREILDRFSRSRVVAQIEHNMGKVGPDIKVLMAPEKHGPQFMAAFRNMEGVLSQTDQGRNIYEAGRSFKLQTGKDFHAWKEPINRILKGLTDKERLAVLELLDTTEEIDAGGSKIEKAAAQIREHLQAFRNWMQNNGHEVGYIEGYFPHIFQGKFWVKAKEEAHAQKVDSLGAALQLAKQLNDLTGGPVTIMQDTFVPPDDATLLSSRGYWRLVKSLQEMVGAAVPVLQDLDAGTINNMLQHGKVAKPKPRQRFFGNLMGRIRNNPNFLRDIDKALDLYIYGGVRKVHQDRFMRITTRNIESMPIDDQRLKKFIEDHFIPGTLAHPTNTEEAIATAVSKLGVSPGASGQDVRRWMHNVNLVQYVMDLGLSFSSAVANASQFWINAYPIVGEKSAGHGYAKAARSFRDHALLKELEDMGITTGVSSVTGDVLLHEGSVKQWARKISGKEGFGDFGEATLALFTGVELYNRFAAYWAGKDYAIKTLHRGGSAVALAKQLAPQTSSLMRMAVKIDNRMKDNVTKRNASWQKKTARMQLEFAKGFGFELNEKTNFRVGRENLPILLREVPVRLIAPYKSFLINQIKYTLETLSPKGLVSNPKKALRFTAVSLALAGVAGNPIIYGLFLAVNRLYEWLYNIDLRRELMRRGIYRGLSGLVGIDISGSVAIRLPTEAVELLGRFGKIGYLGAKILYEKATRAGSITEERMLARQLMPAQIQRAVDAITILHEGEYVTPIKQTPVALNEPAWTAAAKRFMGSMPQSIADQFEIERVIQDKKERYKSLSQDLTERWATAVKHNDIKAMDDVMSGFAESMNDAIEGLDRASRSGSPDAVADALTDVLFWASWARNQEKFENALTRKVVPRQATQAARQPNYMKIEAFNEMLGGEE